jgi:hypothetical protein
MEFVRVRSTNRFNGLTDLEGVQGSGAARALQYFRVVTMNLEWTLAAAALMTGFGAFRLTRLWLRYHGAMLVRCPETKLGAGVMVDARHAALTPPGNPPHLRLSACSRWPERAGCGQECVSQIAASPEDCAVRNILARWYRGKVCTSCGTPFEEISWNAREPGLISADMVSVDWSQVRAESLEQTLDSALPICFSCHMALTLVREHPELAVKRPAWWQERSDRRRPRFRTGGSGR